MNSKPSARSPCIDNCCLDPDDLCVGCGRHLTEIVDWHKADSSERQAIIRRSRQRQRVAAKARQSGTARSGR